ncbi:hypothetical protein [Streptacidiphilus albus]|uniref:hypothetical protein n=1 Tax=Streptacidiphilus albus TaxID=105425 RepID=UPI00054B2AFA|nr:hypothetical protein [Streptacidiphilus albus]
MAMTLVLGHEQGLERAAGYAMERFGAIEGIRCASRAELIDDRRHPRHPRRLYSRYLAGELVPVEFDGYVVDVDDMADLGGENQCFDLARDSIVDTFGVAGDIGYYAIGTRVLVRWLEDPPNREREYLEIWVDLNKWDNPIVTNPNLGQ